jgi:hypothetical protein
MSYDLAVWKGPAPTNAAAATAEYERRMDAMEAALDQTGGPPPATPAIRAFVEAALARYRNSTRTLLASVRGLRRP